MEFQVRGKDEIEETVLKKSEEAGSGKWLLTVTHSDGSLENFVNKTRWRNLGLSFGILGLLGTSVILLVLSAHRAQRAAQRQVDFVSAVSHEFRTPVAVICSAGENLADGIVDSKPQIEKYGNLIRREGLRLSEMVEQILEFAGARGRGVKFEFQPIDIGSLVETVLSESQPLLEEKGFEVEKAISENLPSVLGDANALRHSLQNLLSNAMKYSNGSRWIKVEAETDLNQVFITIADKGIGIEPRELKHIFEPFYRGREAVAEQIHGNGLGLSLVKQTIEAHGGKIVVSSELSKGSRFTIQLPAGNSKS
jgi:signal transduction histidine kinase